MPYYFSPTIGAGTRADPFRPRGSDQPGWSGIDLRPDASRLDGGGLDAWVLHLPAHDPDPLLSRIADAKSETVSAGRLNALRTRLGVTEMDQTRLDLLVSRLLTRPPVNGWKRLLPTEGRYQVWLDGLLADLPVSMGAADNFNRANETPLASPWVRVPASLSNVNLVSNAVQASAQNVKAHYYTNAATTPNQYSQAKQVTAPTGNDWGPAVRMSATVITHYGCSAGPGTIWKMVAGAFTVIASLTVTVSNGDTWRIEASGSTIRALKNGAQVTGSPATDTSITAAGAGAGLALYEPGGAIDDWQGGDLGAGGSVQNLDYDYSR